MKGAIIGDIVGSVYEFHNIRTKDFELFDPDCFFTDDTVMTVAVAGALESVLDLTINPTLADAPDAVVARWMQNMMVGYGRSYPGRGYGGGFCKWLDARHPKPYYSQGNGSAMRVSPVAWFASSLEECERLARISAEVTHNHPDGICGAQATAGAVYLALHGGSKEEIVRYVKRYYDWDFSLDDIRPTYQFDHFAATCEGTVPYAVEAFVESTDFEDTIRNVVSIGGDTDTLGAIAGAIAEAFYGVPDDLWEQARAYLDQGMDAAVDRFYRHAGNKAPERVRITSSERTARKYAEMEPRPRCYVKDDPAYENIRCVYIALPDGMEDEASATVVAIGPNGAEWRDYDLWTPDDEQHFGEVFPPFAQDSYDIAADVTVPGFRLMPLSSCQSLLVHDSIYGALADYRRGCCSPQGRALNRQFRWRDFVDSLLHTQSQS